MATIHSFDDLHRARRDPSWWQQPITLGTTPAGQPITVTLADLCRGTYCLAVQGAGKSSLLETIIYQFMERDEALIVFDIKGDLINNIMSRMPAHKLSRTSLLDLSERDFPFSFNLFACAHPEDEESQDVTRNQVYHAFVKLWPEVRDSQYFDEVLHHLIITLIENPELTLRHIPALLNDPAFRQPYIRTIANPLTRDFWQMYTSLAPGKQKDYKDPLLRRVNKLLREPVLTRILSQPHGLLNFRAAIDNREIILIKLPARAQAYAQSAPIIGTLLMSAIYAATFSYMDTPERLRPGFTLIVDEFQHFATDEYAQLFEEGRAFGIKQFLAHQHRAQFLRGEGMAVNIHATMTARTVIAMQTTPEDARDKEFTDKFTGLRRRPTKLYPLPLERKSDWLAHEDKRVREFFHYLPALEALSKQSTRARAIWDRLNQFLYQAQDQAGKGDNWWPDQREEEAVLLELANVLGKVHTRTEKMYNYVLAEQLEREKQQLPRVQARIEQEREQAVRELTDHYTRTYQALTDELATLNRAEQAHWESLSQRDKAIVRLGDAKLSALGLLTWGSLERRVSEYQAWERQHPFAGLTGQKQPFQGVVHAVESLFLNVAFPWDEYIRLCTKREDIRLARWQTDIRHSQAPKAPSESTKQDIRTKYEQKRAKLESDLKQRESQLWLFERKQEIDPQFADEFNGMVQALIAQPIASDKAEVDITHTLEHLKQREALVSTGSGVSEMRTIDLDGNDYPYQKVPSFEFKRREQQIREQTRKRYCRERSQVEREIYRLFAQEGEQEEEEEQQPKQPPRPPSGNKKQPKPQTRHEAEDDWKPYDED